ncbi:MAG: ribosome maturation factor RimM [Bacteroidota bacterium]|jgi:16S rRNA processing protein RimM
MMDQYVVIGKFMATFGIKGDLVLKHHLGDGLKTESLKTVFLEEKGGKFMPYFIASVKNKNDEEALIQLEGVDVPEKAKTFLRKQVWLPEQEVKTQASKHAPISLLGFTVYDEKNLLGKVLEIIEQPMQILLRIDYQGKEVFVPLNESTLLKIDHKKEKITVSLPEGLLDIYIN